MIHPSYTDNQLTAHVDKAALLRAIDKRIEALQADVKKHQQSYADGLAAEIAKAPTTGMWWWKRPLTEEEIKNDWDDWIAKGWDHIRSIMSCNELISRFAKLREAIGKESVTNVRLSEGDLVALKDYL